jgi:D-glycero-alpha-D-manno-heptose-7-phosphate kinase
VILAKAPLRVSFFGGGSDIPTHFATWGGATISTAIDKYVYVAVMHTPHDHIKVSYSKQELVTNVDDIQNEIVRNALKFFGIKSNIEITSFADIPTIGNGLGGSSAFTCALIKALSAYLGYEYVNPYLIAKTACHIEIDLCGWKIGMQDQFASAFGGMNYVEYANELGNGRVDVKRLDSNAIENYMILIPTHIEHHAAKILDKINFEAKTFVIRQLADMAKMQSTQRVNCNEYGRLLNTAWILKKQMSEGISSEEIDSMYDRCQNAGAFGSKLLGAGGGGYMLAITDSKSTIRQEFSDRTCLDVGISHEGARVVYRD